MSVSDNKAKEDNPNANLAPTTPTAANSNSSFVDVPNDILITARRYGNPLAQYSSSTYNISLYALSTSAFNEFNRSGKWDTGKMSLLIQSGGINTNDSPRNPYFRYDFTIDDLEINAIINTKETRIAANAIDFKFKIYEPYSITFPTILAAAQKKVQPDFASMLQQDIQLLALPLLLVVKFYGYDKHGNVMVPASNSGAITGTNNSDQGNFERAFPIIISKMSCKLDNKVTIYDVQAKSYTQQVGYSNKRAISETPMSISAETVGEAINQLLEIYNKRQKDLSTGEKRKIEVPDQFAVEITDPLISEAYIVDKQFWEKGRTEMYPVKSSKDSNVKGSANSVTVERAKRTIEIPPGTPLMKAIDQIITQSTYIGDSLKVIQIEPDRPIEGQPGANVNPNPKQLRWYNVTPMVTVLGPDNIRKEAAHKTTYYIQPYKIPYVRTNVIGQTTSYKGPDKIYQYYYTGKNSEILQYEQQYNLLYYMVSAQASDSKIEGSNTGTPSAVKATSGASPTGTASDKKEVTNEFVTNLYSPGDQLKAQIKILGDPDFLMPTIGNPKAPTDGAIDPNTGQVFIEINFQQVDDYGYSNSGSLEVPPTFNDDGLLTPNGNIKMWEYPASVKEVAQNNIVYMVIAALSRFSKGVFTQDLKTVLPVFNDVTEKKTEQRETTTRTPAQRTTAADFQRTDKDTRSTLLPNGKPNLAPANPDDPGQNRIMRLPPGSDGRDLTKLKLPGVTETIQIDPRTLLPIKK